MIFLETGHKYLPAFPVRNKYKSEVRPTKIEKNQSLRSGPAGLADNPDDEQ